MQFPGSSLTLKLVVPIALTVLIGYGVAISLITVRSVSTARREAYQKTAEMAQKYASIISEEMNKAALTAHMIALTFQVHKNADSLPKRETFMDVLKTTLENGSNLLGTWTVWEPDAFDGKDHDYVNAPGHDGSGRFIPYWNHVGGLHLEPCVDYDAPGLNGEYYRRPMASGRQVVMEPVTYLIGNKPTTVVSFVSPIDTRDGRVGVAGVDFSMIHFDNLVKDIRPYISGYGFIMDHHGNLVSHPFESRGQKGPIPAAALSDIRSNRIYSEADDDKGEFLVVVPILVGTTGTPWSLAVSVPLAQVLADAYRLRNIIVITGVVSLLVLVVIVVLIIRVTFIRPILEMSNVFDGMASGETPLDTPLTIRANDEFKVLIFAFHRLAGRLKQAINQLSTERDHFLDIFNAAPGPIVGIDADGSVSYINPTLERMTGISRENAVGKNWKAVLGINGKEIGSITALGLEKHDFEVEMMNGSGERFSVFWKFAIRKNSGDRSAEIIAFGNDLTHFRKAEKENKGLEKRLLLSQKLEAVGNLASGIAHDFNNILVPVLGYAEMGIEKTGPSDATRSYFKKIKYASERARELTKQILAFCRETHGEKRPLQLEVPVKETLKFLGTVFPKSIKIHYDFEDQLPMIEGDPTQIHQILMNLCTNSFHAMKNTDGVLRVTVKKTNVTETADGSKSKTYVVLRVHDTGCGIPPDILDRVMEPYFTTKPESEGTGLGLSIVYGIVKEWGGDIGIISEPGDTTVEIRFPALSDGIKHRLDPPEASNFLFNGKNVLLVEDDPDVLLATTSLLQGMGLKVKPCRRPVDALGMVDRFGRSIDLILSDYSMPGMDGLVLSKKINKKAPWLPIVLYSGCLEEIENEILLDTHVKAFISKPFTRYEMEKTLSSALRDEI